VRKSLDKSLLVVDKSSLIDKLVDLGYAFAVWRMPNTSELRFIISLKDAHQTDKVIHELDRGFVLNLYEDNHPKKPFFIAADLELVDEDISIDPRINDSRVAAFFKEITEHSIKKDLHKVNLNLDVDKHIHPFEEKVALAVASISRDEFEKVVLSRFQDVTLKDDFTVWAFFQKISKAYPNAFCSISHLPGKGLWVGASPELLISDNSKRFKTISLAGTKPLEEGQELKEIAWTHKEIEEQALVSRYIINCFKKIRLREFHEHGPKTVKSGLLAHLKTEFEVRYDEVQFEGLADQILELLHPTSAVCGMPIDKTKPWIKELEGYNRAFYAGFLGPVNFQDSTELFVNLRCMKVEGNIARLYAGAGITEGSNPSKEFEETRMKMQVMKRFL